MLRLCVELTITKKKKKIIIITIARCSVGVDDVPQDITWITANYHLINITTA